MIPKHIVDEMMKDRKLRRRITQQSHLMFFIFYLGHYIKYKTAPFQKEIFRLTEDDSIDNLFIVAFRGSSKSTIITTSYSIWSVLGRRRKKCVVILGQTKAQAKHHLMNIKAELEDNQLLRSDLGPFNEESDEWGATSLVFPQLGARITIASMEQSIRGLRQRQDRPDLIICDDIEDIGSCKTREGRDKTYQWFMGEIKPLRDIHTHTVVVGNLLHQDSLMMRLKKDILEHRLRGVFREYPLIDEHGSCLWKGKFPTDESLQYFKLNAGNESAWQREYLLRIIPDDDQVVHLEWIHYFDTLPDPNLESNRYRYAAIGIDLALLIKETADYTAMVAVRVYGYGNDMKIYVLQNPVNERMEFPDTVPRVETLSDSIDIGKKAKIYVEHVGYQLSLAQQLLKNGYPAEGVSVNGQDKRFRLSVQTPAIQVGQVLFAPKGNELLIQQLTGFGSEKHDDLVDAFTLVIGQILSQNNDRPNKDLFYCGGKPGLMDKRF